MANRSKVRWTEKHVMNLEAAGKIRGFQVIAPGQLPEGARARTKKGKKGSKKFGNVKTEYNGIIFDSEKECNRYKDLLLLQLAGEISDLRLQVPYELNEKGEFSFIYIADFVYQEVQKDRTVMVVVEDSKGHRTAEYIRKRTLMKKVLGIIIRET